jgi:spore coat-associated protein N
MKRILVATRTSPRKALAALGALVLAGAVVVGSGASFTSTSANPNNTFTAGNLTHLNSKAGAAILTASLMQPGDSTTGTVDITNDGDVAGDFSLSKSSLVDTPASPAFSAKLDLLVEDCGADPTCTSPTVKYSGKLGAMGTIALGNYAVDEVHRYRFTVTFPDGGTPSSPTTGDNAYKDASTSVQFNWESIQS